MNEYSAKMLGKVLGLIDFGIVLLDKQSSDTSDLKHHKDTVHAIADRAHILSTVISEMEKEREELDKSLSLIADKSDRLLTYHALATGTASTLGGVAEELGHAELSSLSRELLSYHRERWEQLIESSHSVGRKSCL